MQASREGLSPEMMVAFKTGLSLKLAFLDYAARGAAAGRGLGSLRTIHQT